ncbi:MAG: hypothetical protein ACK4SZ_00145 [Allosphingosinicella sp.]|uniref:hypothetical protein n=1 Tax=Allosphingosinicella sp. TaxID=2823234 RepID=UPI00394156F5
MRNLKIVFAALTVSASGLALAQDRPARSADGTFGAEVSAKARAQREGDSRGLGAEVSVLAREQGEARRAARQPTDEEGETVDVADGDEAEGDAGSSQGIGSQVKVLAHGQREPEERGIGEQVRALTPAAERSNRRSRDEVTQTERRSQSQGARTDAEAVAAARGSNREIRGGGGGVADLRSSVANSRSAVAGTRADVAATRAQANAARQDARAAAQQARQVRETVRAARRGRRP